jgi:hypothetical protein
LTRALALGAALSLAGCQLFLDESKVAPGSPGNHSDGGPGPDAGTDAGGPDAAGADAGAPDSGVPDSGAPDAGPADAGSNDAGGAPDAGPAADAGPGPDAGSGPDAGPGLDAGAASTIYIGPHADPCPADTSPSGGIHYVDPAASADSNSGLDPAHPKKHLVATVAAAKTAGHVSPAWEIRICAGTLDERVTLNQAISVKGGYDCGNWTRAGGCFDPAQVAATPAYFGPGAPAALTRLQNSASASASNGFTLLVDGTGITLGSAVVVDGLTIVGPAGPAQSHAVDVANGASPVISNCIISGTGGALSAGASDFNGSIGLSVNGGSPEIRHDVIQGGSGSLAAPGKYFGSVGIYLSGGAVSPHLHDTVILGGSGSLSSSGQGGSVGLFADGPQMMSRANGAQIESNFIHGGTGSTAGATPTATAGVWLEWSCSKDLDLVGNFIHGGSTTGNAGAVGIHSELGGVAIASSLIVGNKIYAGESASSSAPLTAITVTGAQGLTSVVDNFIHAGNKSGAASGPITGVNFGAVQTHPTHVAHNLIYAGGNAASRGYALTLQADPNAGHRIFIDNNILAGSATQSAGILFNECPDSGFVQSLHANLFVNHDLAYGVYGAGLTGACTANTLFTTLATLEPELAALASGNFSYRSDCTADPLNCATRTACDSATPAACLQDLLVSFDWASRGYADLVTVPSWNLNPSPAAAPYKPACQLLDSAYNDWLGVFPYDRDIFQNPRINAGVSVGPVQLAAPCAP